MPPYFEVTPLYLAAISLLFMALSDPLRSLERRPPHLSVSRRLRQERCRSVQLLLLDRGQERAAQRSRQTRLQKGSSPHRVKS